MDDDEEEREFSRSIVYDFFQQAESTFQKMDSNLYVPIAPQFYRQPSAVNPFLALARPTNTTSTPEKAMTSPN